MADREDRSEPQWRCPDPGVRPTLPDPDLQPTIRQLDDATTYVPTVLDARWTSTTPGPEPDVLRFGPGVPPLGAPDTAADAWRDPSRQPPEQPRGRLRRLGRYRLAAVVLAVVLAWWLWPRQPAELRVTGVTARTDAVPGCDAAAEVVAVVRTNGAAGTLTYEWDRYEWDRSDRTSSGPLTERLGKGQHETRLRLSWTFHGRGSRHATARLVVRSPGSHTVSASFTYTCR
ncbi:hypothetical protein [Streptomyces humi]